MNTNITFSLPVELAEQVLAAVKADGTNVSAFIRKVLISYFAEKLEEGGQE